MIKDNIKRKNNLERRQSGIAPEMTPSETEKTQIVESLVEVEADTKEQETEEEKKNWSPEMSARRQVVSKI